MINSVYTAVENSTQQLMLIYYLGKYSRTFWMDDQGCTHLDRSLFEAFVIHSLLDATRQRFWLAKDPITRVSGGSERYAPQSGRIVGMLAFVIFAKHWAPKE